MPPGEALGPVGMDSHVLDVDIGAKASKSEFSAGAEVGILDHGVTIGSKKNNYRFGLSAGRGAGIRLHYRDEDHNGVPELGFGFDFGVGSVDLKSEWLG